MKTRPPATTRPAPAPVNAPLDAAPPALAAPPAHAHDPLPLLLRGLNLPAIAREHPAVLARAEAENWGYRRHLLHLVETEANERLRRRIERQLKESGLPPGKTLGTLDPARLPEKIRRQLPTLLDGDLVRRADNLLCFGLPGRGKSHLVAALGREWIIRHQLKVLFIPTFKLVGQLLVAKRDLKLSSALAKLAHYDVVIIDDLGYVPQGREETDVLFTFLAERYEKQSVVITSNLVFSQWDQIFKDPMTTMAAVDRLVHHALILEFTGESQRLQAARPATTRA